MATIYNMQKDSHLDEIDGGDGHTVYLFPSGNPELTIFESGGGRSVHVGNRQNDWDALDLNVSFLNLSKSGNYTITVTGAINGPATTGTLMLIQLMPGYKWRSQKAVSNNQEFTLTHKFTTEEIANIDTIRITTNDIGADVSFYIHNIIISE
jgi:hypothetical protein